jgi:hypothetical protein
MQSTPTHTIEFPAENYLVSELIGKRKPGLKTAKVRKVEINKELIQKSYIFRRL